MAPRTERVSAMIYQFPVKPASLLTLQHPDSLHRRPTIAHDSCWYHDEAIRKDECVTRD